MSKILLTSDPHYWHKKVIEYCNRPFSDVQDMNVSLMNFYNQSVGHDDTVYFLGDVFFCGIAKATDIFKELRGHKILVKGNHDWHFKDEKWLRLGFEKVLDTMTISHGGYTFRMSHFPYQGQNHDARYFKQQLVDDGDAGTILLHGHVHNTWKVSENKRMINVGVDVWGQKPVNLDDIVKLVDSNNIFSQVIK